MTWYPRLGLPLPFELTNTSFADAGQPRDALASPEDLDQWLGLHRAHFIGRVSVASTPADLVQFRQLRQALRHAFTAVAGGAKPRASDIKLLNEISARAPQFVQLDWTRNARRVRMHYVNKNAHANMLAAVARAAIELLGGPDVDRISQCQRSGCVLLFLKDRRNGQWCSATCGNRARVARHYARGRRLTT
jgi:predicted RNA-binding Zn ribbon-like protein